MNDVVDCNDFLNSLDLFRFDQIQNRSLVSGQQLHPKLLDIYSEVQGYDLNQVIFTLDSLLSLGLGASSINASLKIPKARNFFVFDIKVVENNMFFAAYYSLGNEKQAICEKHGLEYSTNKNIWYTQLPIVGDDFNAAFEKLNLFFDDMKSLAKIFVYRSTMQKYYRVA